MPKNKGINDGIVKRYCYFYILKIKIKKNDLI